MALQGAHAQLCLGAFLPSKQDISSTFLAALPCTLNRLTLFLLTAWKALPGQKENVVFLKFLYQFSLKMFFSVMFFSLKSDMLGLYLSLSTENTFEGRKGCSSAHKTVCFV